MFNKRHKFSLLKEKVKTWLQSANYLDHASRCWQPCKQCDTFVESKRSKNHRKNCNKDREEHSLALVWIGHHPFVLREAPPPASFSRSGSTGNGVEMCTRRCESQVAGSIRCFSIYNHICLPWDLVIAASTFFLKYVKSSIHMWKGGAPRQM